MDTRNELEGLYPEVTRCSKCGFCQPSCPIYRTTGAETSVARGHNAHVRLLIEGRLDLSPDLKDSLFECLLCRACVANCPPAVATPDVVVEARAAYYRRFGRPLVQKAIFRHLLPRPRAMRAAMKPVAWAKRLGLAEVAKRAGLLGLVYANLPKAEGILNEIPTRTFSDAIPGMQLLPAQVDHRVVYFNSCGMNFALPKVAEATVRVLVRSKCAVEIRPNNCCGLPPWSYGDLESARNLARGNLRAMAGTDAEAILTDCGSCSSFLKEYGHLLAGDEAYAAQAADFSAKVRDVSEYLVTIGAAQPQGRVDAVVTYHDPCHLSRPGKINAQPRSLIRGISGVELRELPEADWCCGGAGTYNVAHYDQSMLVLDRKMKNVEKTGASILVTSCPACIMQLSHGVRRAGLNVEVLHTTQLLDRASAENNA
jgi:glycolate oxidase iron-sulfur subunit